MSLAALNVAASGLRAQQKAIDVVSHNIANVNTPGYSRQNANLVTARPETIGRLDLGRGVNVNDIQRTVAPLIQNAQRENASQSNFWNTISSGLTTVESAFGSLDSTGLAASVDNFFLSWQQLSNSPQDMAQKYNVRGKSQELVTQLNSMQTQLSDAQLSLDTDIDQQLVAANTQLDQIGTLTKQIRRHEAGKQANIGAANDLRDQRDESIRILAGIVPIQLVDTQGGGLLIQTKGGDLLTQDGMVRHLARNAGQGATGYQSIVISGGNTPVQGLDQGGKLGGLLALRDNRMQKYMDALDSFAGNLAFATNQLHSNASGGLRSSTVLSGQGAISPALALNDAGQGVPFANQVTAGSFSMHVYDATGTPQLPSSQFTINLAAGATMNDVAAAINDPVTGVVGVSAVIDAAGRLSLDAGTNTVGFADDTTNFLAAYEINTFFHGATAGSLTLSQPILNDAASIQTGLTDPATSLIQAGQNEAAIAILQLQDKAVTVDGTPASSLHNRIAVLSQQYGLDVAVASQQQSYRSAEATSLTKQRDAISGVNLDEELVAMMKFQRAYEASAKVITTSNQMMDVLMGMMR